MPGSVLEMAEWFELPYAPEHRIKLRPLSRLERLEKLTPLFPDRELIKPGMADPPEVVKAVLSLGIVDWTFTDSVGEPLPVNDEHKFSLDDQTTLYAYREIIQLTTRQAGEGNGSVANLSAEPNRRNSRKR